MNRTRFSCHRCASLGFAAAANCRFCSGLRQLNEANVAPALESDSPTCRLLARQGLIWKSQRDETLDCLERLWNRVMVDEDGKVSFDGDGHDFLTLMAQIEGVLYARTR